MAADIKFLVVFMALVLLWLMHCLSGWKFVYFREGKIYEMKFSRGHVVQPMTVIGETEEHGSEIVFKPDGQIFEVLEYNYETLEKRLREQAFLNAGVRIEAF